MMVTKKGKQNYEEDLHLKKHDTAVECLNVSRTWRVELIWTTQGIHHLTLAPFEADQHHHTPDNLFYVKSSDALRRHMAVHHQLLLLRPIPQPDGTKLDMLVVPMVAELTQEVYRYWTPCRNIHRECYNFKVSNLE